MDIIVRIDKEEDIDKVIQLHQSITDEFDDINFIIANDRSHISMKLMAELNLEKVDFIEYKWLECGGTVRKVLLPYIGPLPEAAKVTRYKDNQPIEENV